ncbi:hypothetical protein K456DRAFT_1087544 [Colletotrichum gloeosporioides 23]|nr:hypothetical protein K456DRAFT_1087544 [Colletotrichum gloeosporioides 23]
MRLLSLTVSHILVEATGRETGLAERSKDAAHDLQARDMLDHAGETIEQLPQRGDATERACWLGLVPHGSTMRRLSLGNERQRGRETELYLCTNTEATERSHSAAG